jgi:protein-tyrosine phosphatase
MTFLLPNGIPENDDWPSDCIWRHKRGYPNFSWVAPGVAGCMCPKLDKDFQFLREQGISALVGIWEQGISNGPNERKVLTNGMELYLRKPIKDFCAPSTEQLSYILEFIDGAIAEGHKVAVACGYGEGRTGTVLTCYFIQRGMTPFQALRTMLQRERIPYENKKQRDLILSFRLDEGILAEGQDEGVR